MIITQHTTATNNTAFESSEFRMKSSAQAFKILSSSLYTDKELAVLRELSANADDSHKAADVYDKPIRIHLPTEMEPNLVVTDYGLGMSKSDVFNLYTTYFSSSKQSSNELTGGFGIGSKSPFALTDTFNITSTKHGITLVATAYLDGGVPKLLVLQETQTDLPNQTTITVPVSSKLSQERIAKHAHKLFIKWPVQPIVTLGTSSLFELAQDTTFHSLSPTCYITECLYSWKYDITSAISKVVIGLFEYEIPSVLCSRIASTYPNINNLVLSVKHMRSSGAPVFNFNLPIGSIELSPSREKIEDTAANAEVIYNELVAAITLLTEGVTNNADSIVADMLKLIHTKYPTLPEYNLVLEQLNAKYTRDLISAVSGYLSSLKVENTSAEYRSLCDSVSNLMNVYLPQTWVRLNQPQLASTSISKSYLTRNHTYRMTGVTIESLFRSKAKVGVATCKSSQLLYQLNNVSEFITIDDKQTQITNTVVALPEVAAQLVTMAPDIFFLVPTELLDIPSKKSRTQTTKQSDPISFNVVYDNTDTFSTARITGKTLYTANIPDDALVYITSSTSQFSKMTQLKPDFPLILIEVTRNAELHTKRYESFTTTRSVVSDSSHFWNAYYGNRKHLFAELYVVGNTLSISDNYSNYRELYTLNLKYYKQFLSRPAYKLLRSLMPHTDSNYSYLQAMTGSRYMWFDTHHLDFKYNSTTNVLLDAYRRLVGYRDTMPIAFTIPGVKQALIDHIKYNLENNHAYTSYHNN